MTILKVIIPKGEMPESCMYCSKCDGVAHTFENDRFVQCKIKGRLGMSVHYDYFRSRHPSCPLEEEK